MKKRASQFFIILFILLFHRAEFYALPIVGTPQEPPPSTPVGPDSTFPIPIQAVEVVNPLTGRLTRAVSGELLIVAEKGKEKDVESLLSFHHFLILHKLPEISAYRVAIPAGFRMEQALQQVAGWGGIRSAEFNYFMYPADVFPNDPNLASQWYLGKIRAFTAWNYGTGTPAQSVAVVDTGVDIQHPDLIGKIQPGGWDFQQNDSDPSEEPCVDINKNGNCDQGEPSQNVGHGTGVAGVIAAATNNGIGIAGLAWQTKIFPVRVFPADGGAPISQIANGILYAAREPSVRIINLSLSGPDDSSTLREAIQYAYYHGILIVSAAGNKTPDVYPGVYPETLAVAATDNTDKRAYFSNYGDWVDLSAPGVSIFSTAFTRQGLHTYSSWNGTSFSAPVVSGIAALLFGLHPAWTAQQVIEHLRTTSDDISVANDCNQDPPPDWCGKMGAGRVNAYKAMFAGDVEPPLWLSARPLKNDSVLLHFNEPLSPLPISSGQAGCSSPDISVSQIRLTGKSEDVEAFTSPQQGGRTYALTCYGFQDLSGNQMMPAQNTFIGTNSVWNFASSQRGSSISPAGTGALIDNNPTTALSGQVNPTPPDYTITLPSIEWLNRIVVRGGEPALRYRLRLGVDRSSLDTLWEGYATFDQSISFSPSGVRYIQLSVLESTEPNGIFTLYELEAYRDDITPPALVTLPRVQSLSSTSAKVTWATDEPAGSSIFFRTLGSPEYQTESTPSLTYSHEFTLSNLTPQTAYEYYVENTDGWGNKTQYPEVAQGSAPLTFFTNGSFSAFHQPPRNFGVIGRSIPLSLQVTTSPSSVQLFYRESGASSFQNTAMNVNGQSATGAIPGSAVLFPSMEYYFLIQISGEGSFNYPPSGYFRIDTTIAGDANGDFIVDELDALEVGFGLGRTPASPDFSLNQDADGNGIVDEADIAFIQAHFSESP